MLHDRSLFTLSLCLSHSRSGGGSPPQSAPRSPRGIKGPCWTFLLARCLAGPGRELDTVAPYALLSRQRRCSVDRWQSPGVQYGADIMPTTENDQCLFTSCQRQHHALTIHWWLLEAAVYDLQPICTDCHAVMQSNRPPPMPSLDKNTSL